MIPRIYRSPGGGPLRWQDDVTGVLPTAVLVFMGPYRSRGWTPSAETIELIRNYCEYYVNAPCWSTEGMEAQFTDLRERVKALKSAADIDAWISDARKVGIDPF